MIIQTGQPLGCQYTTTGTYRINTVSIYLSNGVIQECDVNFGDKNTSVERKYKLRINPDQTGKYLEYNPFQIRNSVEVENQISVGNSHLHSPC